MPAPVDPETPDIRLAAVSFLNTLPLIAALEGDPRVNLTRDVPARLPALLDTGRVDAALVPIVDLLARADDWQRVSDACIACDGPTMTVRVYCRTDPSRVRRLHADVDSHTSVALARVIWKERFSTDLELIPLDTASEPRPSGRADLPPETSPAGVGPAFQPGESEPRTSVRADAKPEPPPSGGADVPSTADATDAILLIGDKVVTHGTLDYSCQLDLGAAWKELTGLPFVFAVWAARRDTDTAALAERLHTARDQGVARAEELARQHAPKHGWPEDLAVTYLTHSIRYYVGPRQRRAIQRFEELLRETGFADLPPQKVNA